LERSYFTTEIRAGRYGSKAAPRRHQKRRKKVNPTIDREKSLVSVETSPIKIFTAVAKGVLVGSEIGLVSSGKVDALSPQTVGFVRQNSWWIVLLSMLVPMADHLTGVRTTFLGVVTRHPYRHVAGFFVGLSVTLGLFLLLVSTASAAGQLTLM
jgi:hypothetical protein